MGGQSEERRGDVLVGFLLCLCVYVMMVGEYVSCLLLRLVRVAVCLMYACQ